MRKYIVSLLKRAQYRLQTSSEVARFEGIALADLREESPHFRETILAALCLLKEIDPLRFARVQREIAWIVNCTLAIDGAEYHHETRTCKIDFEERAAGYEFAIGFYAAVLVHEATHGVIHRHGISYQSERRSRIERLCVREENRFLTRLANTQPELAQDLKRDFDEAEWAFAWSATPRDLRWSLIRRFFKRSTHPLWQ
jgi:hypothetical protein